jgi:hypothetical protein
VIGLALCIVLLLGILVGVTCAWAYAGWRAEQDYCDTCACDCEAIDGGGGPAVEPSGAFAKIQSAMAQRFSDEFAERVSRDVYMADLLKRPPGAPPVQWSVSPPAARSMTSSAPGAVAPPCPGDRVGAPAHDCGIPGCTRRSPGAPPYPNPALVDLHAKVAASLDEPSPAKGVVVDRPITVFSGDPDRFEATLAKAARRLAANPRGARRALSEGYAVPVSARPCGKCGHPVGDHDPQLAGVVCPEPPEAA